MAGVAQIDIPPGRNGQQLAFGIFHHLPQGLDGLVPLVLGQAGLGTFQAGQGGAVGAVELHGLGKLELAARGAEANLGLGRRRYGQASIARRPIK